MSSREIAISISIEHANRNFITFLNPKFRGPRFTWKWLVKHTAELAQERVLLETGEEAHKSLCRQIVRDQFNIFLKWADWTPEDYEKRV